MDFPEPLSPTSPTTSLGAKLKSRLRMAAKRPLAKLTAKSHISSIGCVVFINLWEFQLFRAQFGKYELLGRFLLLILADIQDPTVKSQIFNKSTK
jgi:hypothetical protein